VAVDDANKVLLIREFCGGSNSMVLSLPGGSIDANEEPVDAAQRELQEETGMRAASLEKLHFAWTHPSTTNRRSFAFLGLDLQADPLTPSKEIIETHRVPIDDAITNATTDLESDTSTIPGCR
jgi:8-oxo-dGTP pyrophosphatase MutT (NUDIX family)